MPHQVYRHKTCPCSYLSAAPLCFVVFEAQSLFLSLPTHADEQSFEPAIFRYQTCKLNVVVFLCFVPSFAALYP
eukprot:m.189727 g.189727  ORF g.189727 m.189727 type:complete len:74 (-) comp14799_c0_seq2:9-230(-)